MKQINSFIGGISIPLKPVSEALYEEMQLEEIISYEVFEIAWKGYEQIEEKKEDLLTIIDFSKPSTEERFFVLDLENRKILFKTYVTHGQNSGKLYATSFSNVWGSYQSSLGFFLTESAYDGKNGNSLTLNGLEEGINHRAKERYIIIHAADYCSREYIHNHKYLGQSLGCPALPEEICDTIISTIQDGTVMFIYANNKEYLSQSQYINIEDPEPSESISDLTLSNAYKNQTYSSIYKP